MESENNFEILVMGPIINNIYTQRILGQNTVHLIVIHKIHSLF